MLIGSSGVGKSTLVNRWVGHERMAVKETREDDDEGRHTTVHRELIMLPGGGVVIDTPGIRELQLWDSGGVGRGVRRCRGARADVPLQRLLAQHRARVRREGRARVGRAARVPRYESWLKLQRELRAIAIRADARLRREEKRKWQLRTKDARTRTRHR